MLVNSIIHLSDAALIAVHALASLASSTDRLVQSKELAAVIGASEHHLAKVMQRLVHAGLVHSTKGPAGGFNLAVGAGDISFKDAIEAVDGTITGEFCPFRKESCNSETCIFGGEISKQAAEMINILGTRTIADINKDTLAPNPPTYAPRNKRN